MRKTLSILLTITLVITLLSFIGPSEAYAQKKRTKLSSKKIELTVGETKKIKLSRPSKKVKWKVKNEKIVKIIKNSGKKNQTIKIKGLKAGKTKITAKCNKKKYTIKVTVYDVASDMVKPTVETTAVAETTTKVSETETTTVGEPGKLVAKMGYTILSPSDNLKIWYKFDAPTDLVVGIDENPYLLEMYQDGNWVEIPIKSDYENIEGIIGVEYYNPFTLEFSLEDVYGTLDPGHYRYTEEILDHHANTSNQPYDDTISVEFDIVKDSEDCVITATTDDYMYEFGEDVVITYTVETDNQDLITTYSTRPGQLEYSFAGMWYSFKPTTAYQEYVPPTLSVTGSDTFEVSVPISTYYDNLLSGRYIYTTVIGDQKVSVEFYMNYTSTDIAGTLLSDPMTLDTDMEIKYYYTNVNSTASSNYSLYPGMLEIYENEQWTVMKHSTTCPPVPDIACGFESYGNGLFSLSLSECYADLRVGHYRYWHLIGNSLIPVEFDIVE